MTDKMTRRYPFENSDGTISNIKFLAFVTGMPEDEVSWMAQRIGELMDNGLSGTAAAAQAREEGKAEPWKAMKNA